MAASGELPPADYVLAVLDAIKQGFVLPDRIDPLLFQIDGGAQHEYPEGADEERGKVVPALRTAIAMTLDRQGKVTDLQIFVSSLSKDFDDHVLDAIRKADSAHAFPSTERFHGPGKEHLLVIVHTTTGDPVRSAFASEETLFQFRLPRWQESQGVDYVRPPVIHQTPPAGSTPLHTLATFVVDTAGRYVPNTLLLGTSNSRISRSAIDQGFAGGRYQPAAIDNCLIPVVTSRFVAY